MARSEKPLPHPATVSLPRPGDFPVGSLESRAAARAVVEKSNNRLPDFQVVVWVPSELLLARAPEIGGKLPEIAALPQNWTEEQWNQFLAQEPREKLRLWREFFARGATPYFRVLLDLTDNLV